MKTAQADLTTGPLGKKIFRFSIPLIFSNLLQVLFNMADVAVVGRFAGSTALGAVGSTTIFVSLFTGFLIGLSGGVNVLVAHHFGADDQKNLSDTVHSAALTCAAAGLVLLAMVLLRQVCELSGRLPGYLETLPRWTELVRGRAQQLCAACPEGLRSWLEALLDGLSAQLAELLESMGQRCLRAVTAAAAALPQAVLFCATTLLAVLFTAGSYPRIRAFLRRQLPEDRLRQARGVKADLLATLGKWCKAQCILLGVTFCELLAGLLLLRQGYALLLAALIAVIDALPVFGTGTVLVPWGALCLLTGNVPKGLGLLALYGVISLVRSVLEPKIMAAQVDLSPLAALAAMYVGFCAFGVAGMVLCPMALLFVKQLHDSGWLRIWK